MGHIDHSKAMLIQALLQSHDSPREVIVMQADDFPVGLYS